MIENYKNIFIDKVSINKIKNTFSLPIFIYNYKKILYNLYKIKKINFFCFFSVKSNNNIFLLKIISKVINKFDVVSIGEIDLIVLLNKNVVSVIFSGCGKTISELLISLNFNLYCLNIESLQELLKLFYLTLKTKKNINIMIRINPNINANTHKKITTGLKNNKFGILIKYIKQYFVLLKITNLNAIGYDFHLGSQITTLKPFKKLLKIISLIYKIKKFNFIDIGGGIGVDYFEHRKVLSLTKFYFYIEKNIKKYNLNIKFIVELGRFVLANTCILLAKSNYLKFNNKIKISILNIGMNDIIRPALYNSFHKIESKNNGNCINSIFGPICESSDKFKLKNFILLKNNSIIILYSCGSYCKVMSNNYNLKKKISEIIIYKNKIKIIFKKEKNNMLKNYV